LRKRIVVLRVGSTPGTGGALAEEKQKRQEKIKFFLGVFCGSIIGVH